MVKKNRTLEIVLGISFLMCTVLNMIGQDMVNGLIESEEGFQTAMSSSRNTVIIAELIEIVCCFMIINVIVLLYPILKEVCGERFAVTYFAIRIVETAFMALGVVVSMSLLILCEKCVENEDDKSTSEFCFLIGTVLIEARNWTFKIVMIFCFIAVVMFYVAMFIYKLIPRFISVWGLIFIPLVLFGTVLDIFGYPQFYFTTVFPGMILIFLPAGLNEPCLALWLMIKGFSFKTNKN